MAVSDRLRCAAFSPAWIRISALILILIFGSTKSFAVDRADASPRPNLVVILADDLGFSDLGCQGGEIDTPHLDKLAARGVRFSQFYNTARCWPSRAALLTGRYPHEAGHAAMMGPNAPPAYRGTTPERGILLSEVLATVGYRSYHVGKWHVNNRDNPPRGTWPLGRGFSHSYLVNGHDNYFNPTIVYEDEKPIRRPGANGGYYLTDVMSQHAVDSIEEHAREHKDKPFFLYLAYTAPHFPLHALPEDIARHRARYEKGWDKIRAERHAHQSERGLPRWPLSARDPAVPAWDTLDAAAQAKWTDRMAIHAAMVHRLDAGVGRVVKTLETLGILDQTAILFLSDNGASAEYIVRGDGNDPKAAPGSAASYLCLELGWANASNTPFREQKMWVHEGGISTPMILHWPKGVTLKPGAVLHEPGHIIDIMPTLMDIARVRLPERTPALPPISGRSFAPLLNNQPCTPRDTLFWEHEGRRALRKGDWKLVADFQKPWELYNLADDRAESKNLAQDHPEKTQALAELWQNIADKQGVVPWDNFPQSRAKPTDKYRKK